MPLRVYQNAASAMFHVNQHRQHKYGVVPYGLVKEMPVIAESDTQDEAAFRELHARLLRDHLYIIFSSKGKLVIDKVKGTVQNWTWNMPLKSKWRNRRAKFKLDHQGEVNVYLCIDSQPESTEYVMFPDMIQALEWWDTKCYANKQVIPPSNGRQVATPARNRDMSKCCVVLQYGLEEWVDSPQTWEQEQVKPAESLVKLALEHTGLSDPHAVFYPVCNPGNLTPPIEAWLEAHKEDKFFVVSYAVRDFSRQEYELAAAKDKAAVQALLDEHRYRESTAHEISLFELMDIVLTQKLDERGDIPCTSPITWLEWMRKKQVSAAAGQAKDEPVRRLPIAGYNESKAQVEIMFDPYGKGASLDAALAWMDQHAQDKFYEVEYRVGYADSEQQEKFWKFCYFWGSAKTKEFLKTWIKEWCTGVSGKLLEMPRIKECSALQMMVLIREHYEKRDAWTGGRAGAAAMTYFRGLPNV